MEEGKEEQALVFQALSCDNRVTCHVWSDQIVEQSAKRPKLPTWPKYDYDSEIL